MPSAAGHCFLSSSSTRPQFSGITPVILLPDGSSPSTLPSAPRTTHNFLKIHGLLRHVPCLRASEGGGGREGKSAKRKGAREKGRSTAGQRWRPGTEAVPPQSEPAPPLAQACRRSSSALATLAALSPSWLWMRWSRSGWWHCL
jgi:hypothetical protein